MNNPQAFPEPGINHGMTLRDYFAAKAMQGFCANPAIFASNANSGWSLVNTTSDDLCAYAFRIADDMLKERDKSP